MCKGGLWVVKSSLSFIWKGLDVAQENKYVFSFWGLCYKQMCVDLCSLQCIAVSFYTHSIMGEGSYMWQVLMNFPLFLSGCSCHLSGICQFIECDSIST